MLTIDPNQVILDLFGQAVVENGEHMTLGKIAIAVLLTPDRDQRTGAAKQLPIDEQTKRFTLAVKLANASGSNAPCEIRDFESVMLRELIAARGLPLITGRFLEALKSDDVPAASEVRPAAAPPTLN